MEEEIKQELSKNWLKSKTIIFNTFTAVSSFLTYIAYQFQDLINKNLDWVKSSGIEPKYIFAVLGTFGLINVYIRFKTDKAITIKKDNQDSQSS